MKSEKAYHDQFFKAETVLDLNMLSFAYNRVFNFLLKYGIPSSQAKILSLGCGEGRLEIAASRLTGSILGVDISGTAIQKAKSTKLTNVNFLCEDVEKLSFSPDSFDSIWALGSLHHLSDRGRERLIYNCKRWLRPGGIFLSIDPSSLRFVNLFKQLFWKSYRKYHSPNERELNIRDTYNIFREAGFDAVQVRYFDYFQIPLGFIFPNLPKTVCRLLIALDELLVRVPIVWYFASGFAIVAIRTEHKKEMKKRKSCLRLLIELFAGTHPPLETDTFLRQEKARLICKCKDTTNISIDVEKRVKLLTVILSGLRHRWLVYFRPRYTIDSLLKRKGECRRCGWCDILNKPWCRYFKDGKCEIYERQPFFCKIFPIDVKDKEMSGVGEECGYWWDSEKSAK